MENHEPLSEEKQSEIYYLETLKDLNFEKLRELFMQEIQIFKDARDSNNGLCPFI